MTRIFRKNYMCIIKYLSIYHKSPLKLQNISYFVKFQNTGTGRIILNMKLNIYHPVRCDYDQTRVRTVTTKALSWNRTNFLTAPNITQYSNSPKLYFLFCILLVQIRIHIKVTNYILKISLDSFSIYIFNLSFYNSILILLYPIKIPDLGFFKRHHFHHTLYYSYLCKNER